MKATHPTFFSDSVWGGDGDDPDTRAEQISQAWQILLPVIVVAGLIALCLATAPLVGIVVARNPVTIELNRRIAQHQEGGVAREILVGDGEGLRAGQPLVSLGNRRAFRLAVLD